MPNFLVMIIPLAALLATALYAWKRRTGAQHEGGRSGGPDRSRATAPRVGSPDRSWATASSFTNDHEIHASFRSSGTRHRRENSSPTASASADSVSVHREQCKVCYENTELVQLYPCNHKDICNSCATKCLKLAQVCPFCRSRITGFM